MSFSAGNLLYLLIVLVIVIVIIIVLFKFLGYALLALTPITIIEGNFEETTTTTALNLLHLFVRT